MATQSEVLKEKEDDDIIEGASDSSDIQAAGAGTEGTDDSSSIQTAGSIGKFDSFLTHGQNLNSSEKWSRSSYGLFYRPELSLEAKLEKWLCEAKHKPERFFHIISLIQKNPDLRNYISKTSKLNILETALEHNQKIEIILPLIELQCSSPRTRAKQQLLKEQLDMLVANRKYLPTLTLS